MERIAKKSMKCFHQKPVRKKNFIFMQLKAMHKLITYYSLLWKMIADSLHVFFHVINKNIYVQLPSVESLYSMKVNNDKPPSGGI